MTRSTERNQDKNHAAIMEAIAKIDKGQAVIGSEVKELTRRVGIQNGRVADSEAAIKKLTAENNVNKGKDIGSNKMLKRVVMILTLIIAALTYYALTHPHS